MPVTVNGKTYYRTAEICQIAGKTKNTFFRWVRARSFTDAKNRDRRWWRLLTEDDVDRLRANANRINKLSNSELRKGQPE